MYEKLNACPSCGSSKIANWKIIEDYSISKEKFALQKCLSCELIFTNPRPDLDHIGTYYEADHYISHTDQTNTFKDWLYKRVRYLNLRKKVRLITQLSRGRHLLDYGCGTAHFLKVAESAGFNIAGIEPNDSARSQANNLLGKDKVVSTLDALPDQKFDIITLWHVLEHVHDLNATLIHLKFLLEKHGYLIVAVPNIESPDAKLYGKHWAALDVPRHLYHFSKTSLTHLMSAHGLKLLDTKPMKFDSYYVSLLSEQYEKNKSSYLRAFINGYKSNRDAKASNNHSSLIFILQHA